VDQGGFAAARKDSPQQTVRQVADLQDSDIGAPVAVLARVAEADTKSISIQVAVFRCGRCARLAEEVQTTEQLKFPITCSTSWGGCGAKRREAHFKLLEKESVYAESQTLVLADDAREEVQIGAMLRGQLAGSLPVGAQGTFRGRLKRRSGKMERQELPYLLEVAEVDAVQMPDRLVVYPRRVDPQVIYNIIVERQRRGEPTNYKVIVDEARKIGLTEDDVRAMLSKLLGEGKLVGQEKDEARRAKDKGEGSDTKDI
jgi:DNA replicative helicase MCM subunit Mcm2 (Cdc46/Mcm family)